MRAPSSRFKKILLDNGLTVVTERHEEFRSLSIGVWVKAGTRHEWPADLGMSHFIEHMLFKGTKNRTALGIAQEIDRVGGDFNAFTSREYTCFHLLLLNRDLSLGMDILSDIVLNSRFDPDELERERKVILQEIAMVEESPEELVHDLFFERVYGRHGLGRPILGSESSIRRMRRANLLRFFRQHYRPENLIISVSGDVSPDAVRKRLGPLCRARWPERGGVAAASECVAPPPVRSGCWWIVRATEQVHVVWGVEAPKYSSRDRFAISLLNVFLGGGMSSTLFQEIREKKGLAYTVYSSLSPFIDSGLFTVYAATAPHHVGVCLNLIEECVGRLTKDLLSDDELKATKDNLKGTILLSADSAESRMSSVAKNELFFSRYISVDEVCQQIDAVTSAEIRRVARRLFGIEGEGRRSVVVLGPSPSKQARRRLGPVTIRS